MNSLHGRSSWLFRFRDAVWCPEWFHMTCMDGPGPFHVRSKNIYYVCLVATVHYHALYTL